MVRVCVVWFGLVTCFRGWVKFYLGLVVREGWRFRCVGLLGSYNKYRIRVLNSRRLRYMVLES